LRKEEERNKHVIGLFRRPFSYIKHFCFSKGVTFQVICFDFPASCV